MKVEIHLESDGTKIVSFGNYCEYDNDLALAVSNTTVTVTHLDVNYNRYYNYFEFYPRGHIQCVCCKNDKVINLQRPAYIMYFPEKVGVERIIYNSLVCHDCRIRCGKHAYLGGIKIKPLTTFGGAPGISRCEAQIREKKFILRCLVRRWKKRAKQSSIRNKALATLKPYIMHWGCRPGGPLYRLAIKRLNS